MQQQKCKYCGHYTAYYKQLSGSFARLSIGFCAKHQKIQTQFETCGDFANSEKKEKNKEQLRLHILDYALNSINEIAQILKEKESEKSK